MPSKIVSNADVLGAQLTVAEAKMLALKTKLPVNSIYRLNDLLMFAHLDFAVEREYRLCMKRRLYIRCMRAYAELFTGKKQELGMDSSALAKPYLYNDLMEDD